MYEHNYVCCSAFSGDLVDKLRVGILRLSTAEYLATHN